MWISAHSLLRNKHRETHVSIHKYMFCKPYLNVGVLLTYWFCSVLYPFERLIIIVQQREMSECMYVCGSERMHICMYANECMRENETSECVYVLRGNEWVHIGSESAVRECMYVCYLPKRETDQWCDNHYHISCTYILVCITYFN